MADHPYRDPKKIYFFFDYISHNAYLAWHRLPELAQRHELIIEPVPVLFAALLKAYNQVGPAELPVKSGWMLKNVLRKARKLQLPMAPPASHPFNPLAALRLSCCELPRAARADLITRLYAGTWAQSRAMHEPAVLQEIVREAGFDADALLAEADSEPVKRQLRDNGEQALAAGVFGVPTMIVRGELFWGYDDWQQLEDFLAGRDPLGHDGSALAGWDAVRPSAQRRK
ncbi:MAG TPA: 2-hydroxychromene-2-carboxylate isomerase [Nevskiaceae bacterium]|nr:2-hydroxychromene-2-carboxylate isomerase [Nevskiaceae bacterium]